MKHLLFVCLLSAFPFGFGSNGEKTCAPAPDTSVRGTFVNGVPFLYRPDSDKPMSGQVAELLEFIPNIKTETLAGFGRMLTDEEFDALSPSQQAILTEAVEAVRVAEGDKADTAYEYLKWLEQELSPGATVEILEDDADLISFLLQGLSSAELSLLPADVQKVLCGAD